MKRDKFTSLTLIFLIVLVLSPLCVTAQCEEEESILISCLEDLAPAEPLSEDGMPPSIEEVEEACATESNNFETCVAAENNNEAEDLWGCLFHLHTWQYSCVPFFPFSCLLECTIATDITCNDFEANICPRYHCCPGCRSFLDVYHQCVLNNENMCPDVTMPEDCGSHRTFWQKFGIGVGIVLAIAAGVGLMILGIICYYQRKKKNDEESLKRKEKDIASPTNVPLNEDADAVGETGEKK